MTALSVTPVEIGGGVGVLIGLFVLWRAGARRARATAEAVRSGARLVSLAGRVLFNAAFIVGVQWVVVVVTHSHSQGLLLAVLGLPDLLAAFALTRALTVTTNDLPRRRGGGRR